MTLISHNVSQGGWLGGNPEFGGRLPEVRGRCGSLYELVHRLPISQFGPPSSVINWFLCPGPDVPLVSTPYDEKTFVRVYLFVHGDAAGWVKRFGYRFDSEVESLGRSRLTYTIGSVGSVIL